MASMQHLHGSNSVAAKGVMRYVTEAAFFHLKWTIRLFFLILVQQRVSRFSLLENVWNKMILWKTGWNIGRLFYCFGFQVSIIDINDLIKVGLDFYFLKKPVSLHMWPQFNLSMPTMTLLHRAPCMSQHPTYGQQWNMLTITHAFEACIFWRMNDDFSEQSETWHDQCLHWIRREGMSKKTWWYWIPEAPHVADIPKWCDLTF